MTLLDGLPEQQSRKNQNPVWTDEKIEELKRLCSKGLSARQMAPRLGFATRSAIIGKMHRLGLSKTIIHNQRPEIQRKRFAGGTIPARDVCPQVIHKAHYTKKKRLRISLAETPSSPPTAPVYVKDSKFDELIPFSQHRPDCSCTLLQLTNHSCRWPIGDPQKADFFFCGAYTEYQTYCKHHTARAGKA